MTASLATGGFLCPTRSLGMATGGYLCNPVSGILGVVVVLDLIGIVDDGSLADPTLPDNPRKAVSVVFGESVDIRLQVVNRDGSPRDLSNAAVELNIKREPEGESVVKKTFTNQPAKGRTDATVVTDDYRQLRAVGEQLIYDIFLTDGAGRVAIIPLSRWAVESAAAALP